MNGTTSPVKEGIWIEKYRPRSLSQIVGQEAITSRLKGYVEKKDLPHLLFSGPAGVGKTTSSVAIAQGSLTIRVTEAKQVSQPGPFAEVGTTTTTDRTNVEVEEGEERRLTVLKPGVSLQELVNGLNALGIGPRDMITILQAVKASGALQADIEVM